MNAFLKGVLEEGFDKDKFAGVKESMIKSLEQVNMNYLEEVSENWTQILENQLQFDKYERYIEEIDKLTAEAVFDHFEEMFFKKPQRLNVKLWSKEHKEDNKFIFVG